MEQITAAAAIRRAIAEMPFPPKENGQPHRLWWADFIANEEALCRRVAQETGAQIDETPRGFRIRLAGRTATSTIGYSGALKNWCTAVERGAA